jgi:tetratricopeptide (TPR) repeat protein
VKRGEHMFRERPAELTNEAIEPWLREHADERFFCWVHYFDPHATYSPPEPFRGRYADDLYDGEIAYADSQLGELLALLGDLDVRDRTLVIMTSDHGEGLGEHGEMTHSLLIHDATVHVPLVIEAPGVLPQGQVVRRQVSLVDIAPTVLDLLGVDAPVQFDGVSLLTAPEDGEMRPAYIETLSTFTLHGWAPLMGVRRDDYKYVLAPRRELYDLREDPGELNNLYDQRPELAQEFQDLLHELTGGGDPFATGNFEMDEEQRRALEALGYVASVSDEQLADETPEFEALMDPKDGVHHWDKTQKAVELKTLGDIEGAVALLEECVEEVPRDLWARNLLTGGLMFLGKYDQALEVLLEAEKIGPTETVVKLGLANAYQQKRQFDLAEQKVAEALALRPNDAAAYFTLARIKYARQQFDEMFEAANKALELDHGTYKTRILGFLGDIYFQRGEIEEAREHYTRAVEIDEFSPEAHSGLAEILIREGELDQAMEHLNKALRFSPAEPRPLAVAAGVMNERGQYDNAIQTCRRVLNMRPTFAGAYVNLGLAYRKRGDVDKAIEIYHEGIERCPPYDALHQNLAQALLYKSEADAAGRSGLVEEAVGEFRKAVQINPRNAVGLANLGIYHMQSGRHELAMRFFARAIRIRPDYALAHRNLGFTLLEMERMRRAVHHLERSLELDPDQPDAGQLRHFLEELRAEAEKQPPEPLVIDESEDLDSPPIEPGNGSEQP